MVVYHLAVKQKESGLEPMVGYWVGGPLVDRLKGHGVEVHRVTARPKIRRLASLAKLIHTTKPQVLHTHLFAGGFYGRLAGLVARVPVMVRTFHSRSFAEKQWKRKWPEKMLAPFTDGLVCVSSSVRDHLMEKTKWPGHRLLVIHNGIDVGSIKKAAPGFHQPPVLLSVGRVEPVKGFDILLRALKIIRDNGGNFRYILAGDGSQLPALKKLASQLGLDDRVLFKGYVNDVTDLLAEADLFVAPSYSEGFSMSLLEAMAAELSVVASDLPTFREALGDSGRLVPRGNETELAAVLSEALNHPDESMARGQMGRSRVVSMFTLQHTVQGYTDLYVRLLEAKGIHP
jgi:glycosyltransferase involved in cell wall biosynthesis